MICNYNLFSIFEHQLEKLVINAFILIYLATHSTL